MDDWIEFEMQSHIFLFHDSQSLISSSILPIATGYGLLFTTNDEFMFTIFFTLFVHLF